MNKKSVSNAIATVNCVKLLTDNIMEESSDNKDTTDEEELTVLDVLEQNKNYTKKKITRIIFYVEKTVPKYSKQQFQQHFRLSRNAYENLLKKIGPALQRKGNIGRHTINPEKQLLATLWILATPDSYR